MSLGITQIYVQGFVNTSESVFAGFEQVKDKEAQKIHRVMDKQR